MDGGVHVKVVEGLPKADLKMTGGWIMGLRQKTTTE